MGILNRNERYNELNKILKRYVEITEFLIENRHKYVGIPNVMPELRIYRETASLDATVLNKADPLLSMTITVADLIEKELLVLVNDRVMYSGRLKYDASVPWRKYLSDELERGNWCVIYKSRDGRE